jgi:hypothetical protein
MEESDSAATGNMHILRELREERLPYGIVLTCSVQLRFRSVQPSFGALGQRTLSQRVEACAMAAVVVIVVLGG